MTVGTKVICINDVFPDWIKSYYTALPIKGETYTIRDIGIGVSHSGQPGEVCVYLKELINPCSDAPPDYPERGFNAERFAPLETIEEEETETNKEVVGLPQFI